MPKLYTRTGDDGFAGRLGEGRLPKNDPLFEAIGAVDEATAAIGLARVTSNTTHTKSLLLDTQKDLYYLMAELSATKENAERFRKIDDTRVCWLEEQTDALQAQVNLPEEFIVPGDSIAGAHMAIARTLVRRAERQVAGLYNSGVIENVDLLRYLNRLSSLCFILELFENEISGKSQPTLAKERGSGLDRDDH
jgi:cob(I)alamin adenosyltransferase